MPATELVTVPFARVEDRRGARRRTAGTAVALLALVAVVVDAGSDLLSDAALVWVLTPLRLVVGAGLVGLLLARPAALRTRTALDVAVVGLLLATALATVAAGQDWSGLRGVLTGAAVYVLAAGLRRAAPDGWPAICLATLVAVAAAALPALHQAAAGTATGFCRAAVDASADVCGPGALVRVDGTFPNPNLLAGFLVLLLPVAATGAAALHDRWSRLLGTAVLVVGWEGAEKLRS